jgi:hypothetical protein
MDLREIGNVIDSIDALSIKQRPVIVSKVIQQVRFPDIEGQRRDTIETETVRQNDTEAGELLQNQGESSITESRCTEAVFH